MPNPATPTPATDISPSFSRNIDALLSLTKWGGVQGASAALSFSFPWSGGDSASFSGPIGGGGYSLEDEPNATYHFGLNTTEQAAARGALKSWANVANISFVEVADTADNVGDIRFAFSSAVTDAPGNAWGWASYPNSYWPNAGDVWIGAPLTDYDWSVSSYNFFALIHEVGHALGLKHPFEDAVILPAELDNRLYSVMSYTNPVNDIFRNSVADSTGSISTNYFRVSPETPMVLDIAAIQYLYGANTRYHSGADVYTFDTKIPFFKTIWDGGGIDTISVSNFSENCRIDLRPGSYSSIRILPAPLPSGQIDTSATYDGTNNLGIAYGAIIENAIGGSGSDTLVGNSSNNRLDGRGGADKMSGGSGNDTYVVDNASDVTTESGTALSEVDAVLSSVSSYNVVMTAGVDAITLPTPIAGDEGNIIDIWSATAQQHTVTAASAAFAVASGSGLRTICTFPAQIGAGIKLRVCNLLYHVIGTGGTGTNSGPVVWT